MQQLKPNEPIILYKQINLVSTIVIHVHTMKAFSRVFVLVVVFGFAYCEVPIKSNDKPEKLEKGRMVGIDTVHDIPINKDTIITRNFIDNSKLDWKNGRKGGMCLYFLLSFLL